MYTYLSGCVFCLYVYIYIFFRDVYIFFLDVYIDLDIYISTIEHLFETSKPPRHWISLDQASGRNHRRFQWHRALHGTLGSSAEGRCWLPCRDQVWETVIFFSHEKIGFSDLRTKHPNEGSTRKTNNITQRICVSEIWTEIHCIVISDSVARTMSQIRCILAQN